MINGKTPWQVYLDKMFDEANEEWRRYYTNNPPLPTISDLIEEGKENGDLPENISRKEAIKILASKGYFDRFKDDDDED